MANFPKSESKVVELCELMINGFTEHEDDFPSCGAAGLTAILADYKNSRDAMVTAQSATTLAVETKDTSLEVLMTSMKDYLKKAETDTTADPSKLTEIGWGPKAAPTPLQPPGFPGNLHAVAEGNGMIYLAWDRPASGTGGDVWYYIIERQQQTEGGAWSQWTLVANCNGCEGQLSSQPLDVRLQYQVRAVNRAGQSTPSNIVAVTLP